MPSATLTVNAPPMERYRHHTWKWNLGGCLLGLVDSSLNIFGGGHYRYATALYWALFSGLFLLNALSIWSEFQADSLVLRRFWHTQFIPYGDISSVELDERHEHTVTIHYTGFAPNTFPLAKAVIDVERRNDFLDALQQRAPQAEFPA